MTSHDSFDPSRSGKRSFEFDLDSLLHPAQAFAHPTDVGADPDLTLNEKRAILAAWASDACAVEAVLAQRQAPGSPRPIPIDDIVDALRTLDKEAQARAEDEAKVRRVLRRKQRDLFVPRRRRDPGAGDRSV